MLIITIPFPLTQGSKFQMAESDITIEIKLNPFQFIILKENHLQVEKNRL